MLKSLIEAILGAILGFLGQRLDRKTADDAQREAGAREAEAKANKGAIDAALAAAEIRNRPVDDGDLDDRMRDPARRRPHDQS